MARKRLSVPFAADPAEVEALTPGTERAPEVKAMPFGPAARSAPRPATGSGAAPISRVAAETSATAALELLAAEVAEARAQGRLVEALSLDAVDDGHLVRDRVGFDGEEFEALIESLRAHGQRAPIEVVDLGPTGQGRRYGLISGWRRLSALRRLHEETGEARFATVLALLRAPEGSGEAYVAMVEENEIRAGLSYYERARIAAKAVEAGAFADRQAALRALYATASRAKRSKIGSFLALHDALEGALRFPAAIPERLGLQIAGRLAAEPGEGAALAATLTAAPAAGPEAELAALARWAAGPRRSASASAKPAPQEIVPGIGLTGGARRIVLAGPAVTPALRERLEAWLREEAARG